MLNVLSWSFPIGQLFNIAIRVHFVLPLVMISLVAREAAREGAPIGAWQDAAMLMVLMFFSILLHEFGHCFAARFVDGEADEVLLWPLGGLAFCRSLPHTPLAHFVFAVGGPLVNVGLCIVTGALIYLFFEHLPPFNPFWSGAYRVEDNVASVTMAGQRVDNLMVIVLARAFWINWILLLFNLMPGHPFDGGRMLQAGLWPSMGYYQASKVSIYSGFVVMIVLGVYSIIAVEPLLTWLAFFVFFACSQEWMSLETSHEDSLFGYDFSQGYTSLEKDETPAPPKPKKQNFIQRWLAKRAALKLRREQEQREADDRRMDELLDKIQKFGKGSLTDEEQRFLKRVADRYKNKP